MDEEYYGKVTGESIQLPVATVTTTLPKVTDMAKDVNNKVSDLSDMFYDAKNGNAATVVVTH